ncbi:MAG: 1-acyl-sn-glycerol-3-phosphate acyltransferase [Myxococcaceae bacterium]|nr:1-acyl-sn-glycerol-3-phosphate acyltransferase [Myxococcaceae bacterium]
MEASAPEEPAVRVTPGAAITTAWFWLLFAVTAPICLLLGTLIFLFTLPFDRDRRAIHAFICRWTFLYLRASPLWRAEVRGRERLPPGPAVLVANHQSMADVVAAMGLFHPYKFVSKASLFSVPVVGWLMRMAKYVRLERGSPGSTRRMMEACRNWLRRGMPVLIFPEGTYSGGRGLLDFKRGAFALAMEEHVPVVPVVLKGTAQLIRGDGPFVNARSDIQVEVLEPISPAQFGENPDELARRVRALFEAALAEPGVTGGSQR